MDPENVIEIRGLRKSFRTLSERTGILRRSKERTVIDGIDLDIRKGETLGIIGRNGAGKSTLLRLLSGIIEPDEGEIRCDGRIASILNLNLGFHNDLSGIENIEIMCGYYGMGRDEISGIRDRIVEYSGLGDAILEPVRNYSKGMSARLAMSILVFVDADIIILDEVLSVGDASFSAKSGAHFGRLISSGRTMILTSHRLRTIEQETDRVVWLDGGRVRMIGDPHEVCEAYMHELTGTDEAVASLAESGERSSQYKLAKKVEASDRDRYLELVRASADGGWAPANREMAAILRSQGDTEGATERYLSALGRGDRDSCVPYAVLRAGMGEECALIESALTGDSKDDDPFLTFNRAMAILMSDPSRSQEAAVLLRQSWDNGNADAGYRLALMKMTGSGVPMSVEEGLAIMEEVAGTGHYKALESMASLYTDGELVPKDEEKAFRWNLAAARSGNQRAQFTVACIYRDGTGTEADDEEADRWFAAYVRSEFLDQYMTAAELTSGRDPETARRLYELMLTTGNGKAVAQAEKAGILEPGDDRGTAPRNRFRHATSLLGGEHADPERAVEMLNELAASGMTDAMMVLAKLYKDGEHVEADEEMYKSYIRRAAELGDRRAKTIVDRWGRRNARRSRKRSKR